MMPPFSFFIKKLEQIVWPHVKQLLLDQLYKISNVNLYQTKDTLPQIVVVEAAVLLDANWDDNNLFDAIWVVRSSSQVSADRLVENRGMEKDDALKRMEAQQSRRGIGNLDEEIEKGVVTGIIDNNGVASFSESNNTNNNDEAAIEEMENNVDNNNSSGNELWNIIRQYLTDAKYWKEGRCPGNLDDIMY